MFVTNRILLLDELNLRCGDQTNHRDREPAAHCIGRHKRRRRGVGGGGGQRNEF